MILDDACRKVTNECETKALKAILSAVILNNNHGQVVLCSSVDNEFLTLTCLEVSLTRVVWTLDTS